MFSAWRGHLDAAGPGHQPWPVPCGVTATATGRESCPSLSIVLGLRDVSWKIHGPWTPEGWGLGERTGSSHVWMLGKENALSSKDESAEQSHPGCVKPHQPPWPCPAVCHLLGHGKVTESLRPSRPPGPTNPPALPRPLNHIPKCHMSVKPLRGWGLQHCLGSLCQGLTTFSVKKFSLISNLNLPPASISPQGLLRSHLAVTPQGFSSLLCPILLPAGHSSSAS